MMIEGIDVSGGLLRFHLFHHREIQDKSLQAPFSQPSCYPEVVDDKKSSWNIVFVVVVHHKLNCDSDHILPRKNKVETCHRRMEAASGTDALELNGF
jgi:hypothetical protein